MCVIVIMGCVLRSVVMGCVLRAACGVSVVFYGLCGLGGGLHAA